MTTRTSDTIPSVGFVTIIYCAMLVTIFLVGTIFTKTPIKTNNRKISQRYKKSSKSSEPLALVRPSYKAKLRQDRTTVTDQLNRVTELRLKIRTNRKLQQ